jgi:L-rhamnose 1-dehydrogenase
MPSPMTGRLQGKAALVTGGGTGIGREICLLAAREGADVVIAYHSSEGGALAVEREIRALGGRGFAIKADIGVPQEASGLVARALDAVGPLHILVNNAAVVRWASFLDYAESDWNETFTINLRAPFLMTQEVARAMVRLGIRGRIINISSVGGIVAHEDLCAYDASKAALDMLTRSAAVALGPQGITVNSVCPGAIKVERNREEFAGSETEGWWQKVIPLGHAGLPQDIAHAVIFLASEEAQFVNGHVLVVDGGQSIAMAKR